MKKKYFTSIYDKNCNVLRQIRSFTFRRKRFKKEHLLCIEKYWTLFGIEYKDYNVDINKYFKNNFPLILEIGFGSGLSLVNMALLNPQINFLGIEVYLPGIARCLKQIDLLGLNNLRIIFYDAVEVINTMISNASISRLHIFFPDPWHKTRHHKRRLIQTSFANIICTKLITGGILHISTDCKSYAVFILKIFSNIKNYINLSDSSTYVDRPMFRETTKYEQRGQLLKNKIFDLIFKRIN